MLEGLDLVCVSVRFGVDRRSTAAAREYYGVHRLPSKNYKYKALKTLGLQAGDLAVVCTESYGLTVVTVDEIKPLEGSPTYYKWVMAKINIAETQQLIDRVEESRKIMQKLETMAQEERKKLAVREVLKDNPEAQFLLRRLEALTLGVGSLC